MTGDAPQPGETPRTEGNPWSFDPDALLDAVRPNTRVIVVNFPHSPTGAVASRSAFQYLAERVEELGIALFSDEVYRYLEIDERNRLPAAVDLGFLHVILSELAPEIADNPERPRATNAAAQSEYAQLAGMSLAELTAAMKPYLPIVRTFVVLGDVVPSLRERLIQRIEAGLRSED